MGRGAERLVAVVVLSRRDGVAAVGTVGGARGLAGLAAVQRVRVATDLVRAAVVARAHLAAGAAVLALVVLPVRHGLAGEGAGGVQRGTGTRARAVVQVVGVLAQPVVAAVVTCSMSNNIGARDGS